MNRTFEIRPGGRVTIVLVTILILTLLLQG